MKNTTSIKIPKKYQHMLTEIFLDDDGYWAFSQTGFHFADMGGACHTIRESRQADLLGVIRTLEKCDCDQCF